MSGKALNAKPPHVRRRDSARREGAREARGLERSPGHNSQKETTRAWWLS